MVALTVDQTTAEDLGEVTNLLRQGFRVDSDSVILDEELLRWKYHDSHPEWVGARGFVVRDGTKVVAHAAVWPQTIRTPAAEVRALGFYDWVSDGDYPGAGLQIVKHLLSISEAMLVIGGAEITRKILPRFGFTPAGSVSIYARVLRPWKQFRMRPASRGWREVGRIGRNVSWSLKGRYSHKDWRAELVLNASDEQFLELERKSALAGTIHSSSFLDYYRRCPSTSVQLFRLLRDSECVGYFAFSCVDRQIRILDLRVVGKQEDWNAACSLTIQKAREDREAVELIGVASTPQMIEAYQANQFQNRDSRPVFLYDPSNVVRPYLPLQVGMLDDDSGFLAVPTNPYLT